MNVTEAKIVRLNNALLGLEPQQDGQGVIIYTIHQQFEDGFSLDNNQIDEFTDLLKKVRDEVPAPPVELTDDEKRAQGIPVPGDAVPEGEQQ